MLSNGAVQNWKDGVLEMAQVTTIIINKNSGEVGVVFQTGVPGDCQEGYNTTISPKARAATLGALTALLARSNVVVHEDGLPPALAISVTALEAGAEEELWTKLSELDAEQLTAVLEDAGAVLFCDRTVHSWLRWRRIFTPRSLVLMFDQVQTSRRFVPDYAGIVDAVEQWMDDSEGGAAGVSLERRGRKLWARIGDCRWGAGALLAFFEIAGFIGPFVFSLDMSLWARYNLMVYLVLHSAAFFWCLWNALSAAFRDNLVHGNLVETDLLLLSVAVLVRKRRTNPSFPQHSLLDLMRDARCLFRTGQNGQGVNRLFPPECPHGTANIWQPTVKDGDPFRILDVSVLDPIGSILDPTGSDSVFSWKKTEKLDEQSRVGLFHLAGWQVKKLPHIWGAPDVLRSDYDTRLAPQPEPNPSGPETLLRPCTFTSHPCSLF